MPDVLPASDTKHLTTLHHPLPSSSTVVQLLQRSIDLQTSAASSDSNAPPSGSTKQDGQLSRAAGGSTGTTGTTLWLGAQVLACYLGSALPSQISRNACSVIDSDKAAKARQTVLELGSGTGYLALVMASIGYDVIATDVEPVVTSILESNIQHNMGTLRSEVGLGVGEVEVRELDWTRSLDAGMEDLALDVDMVVMSDTIYHPDLNPHLFETIRFISRLRLEHGGPGKKAPAVYLALERRDPVLVDAALALAEDTGFTLKRVGQGNVVKAVKSAGWGLQESDWEGVEVWKGKWSKAETK